jgi:hypothetical protein
VLTLGALLQPWILNDLGALGKLAHHAAILLVHEHHLAVGLFARPCVGFARRVVLRVVLLQAALALVVLRRLRALEEGGALRQDGFKGVYVLLRHRAGRLANCGELYPRESTALGAQVPSRDEVAARRLVVDLCGRREREIKLRREVEVQVEVFFGRLVLPACVAEVCKGRVCGHHQQRERLRPRGCERRLLALLDVVGLDAANGVEKSRIAVAAHVGRLRVRGVSCGVGVKGEGGGKRRWLGGKCLGIGEGRSDFMQRQRSFYGLRSRRSQDGHSATTCLSRA